MADASDDVVVKESGAKSKGAAAKAGTRKAAPKKAAAKKATTKKSTAKKSTAKAATRKAPAKEVPAKAVADPAARAVATITPEQRRAMIAEAAYYRAQQRGFNGGDEVTDWLAAEAEIDARLERRQAGS